MRSFLVSRGLITLFAAASLSIACAASENAADAPLSRASFTPANWAAELDYEQTLKGMISKGSIREFHERLAREPNRAGTAQARKTAQWIMDRFATFGLETSMNDYEVLLAEPIDASLEIIAPETVKLSVRERVLSEDPSSAIAASEFGWNAYSGTGEAVGRVVYANYGRKEDFEKLAEMGVDLKGAIVLARYGGNFRGYKAQFAEEAGAAGLIIFTDPGDSGKGDGYPKGVWANGTTIQRGSIITNEHRGDPLTPGRPSIRGQERLAIEDAGLPTIPVQPIGWDAAYEILSRMRGVPSPDSWKGGLEVPYVIGGDSDLQVRLKVAQARNQKPVVNTVGLLKGSEEPDKLVIVGCHYDAWVCGAWDPASGMAVVMELARAFGEAAKDGLRPKRSIMFVAWDAEEFGLMGSTEWGEDHGQRLTRSAVAYINLDAAVSGPRFGASAWPSLKTLIAEAAGAVPALEAHTNGAPTVLDDWIGFQGGADMTPRIGEMGGGSDHSVFLFHLGVPSASAGVGGAPLSNYHSVYDSLHWYQTFVLPDYEPAAMLARVIAVEVARLANADLLPMDHGRTLADFRVRLAELTQIAQDRGVPFDPSKLDARAEFLSGRWEQASKAVREAFKAGTISDTKMQSINGLMLVMDRAWVTQPKDSDGRWHRNLYIGPDDFSGYAPWPLPPLRRAIEARDEDALATAVARYNKAFDQLSALLMALELAARPD